MSDITANQIAMHYATEATSDLGDIQKTVARILHASYMECTEVELIKNQLISARSGLRTLRAELQAERELADRLVECLRGAMSASYDWKPALIAIEQHAEWRAK